MELTPEEKVIVDRILNDMAVLQKEFTGMFFFREVRRDLVIEKIAELHLKLAELGLAREITEIEIREKIQEFSKGDKTKNISNLPAYLHLIK